MLPKYFVIEENKDDEDFPDYFENVVRDTRDIKRGIKLHQDTCGTYVFVVAVNNNYENNRLLEISCNFGKPLNSEVHDMVKDAYHVEGVDFLEIGMVHVNYRMSIDHCMWDVDIPLSISVIKRYMTEDQRLKYDRWRSIYYSAA
jgi:hypothetical protein